MTDLAAVQDRIGWAGSEIARRLGTSEDTVRQWRNKRRDPHPDVLAYLERVARAIEAVGPPPAKPRVGNRPLSSHEGTPHG